MKDTVPNPGSPEAVAIWCTCPIMDNSHGFGILGGTVKHPDDGKMIFIFHEDCPVHGTHTGVMNEIKEQ